MDSIFVRRSAPFIAVMLLAAIAPFATSASGSSTTAYAEANIDVTFSAGLCNIDWSGVVEGSDPIDTYTWDIVAWQFVTSPATAIPTTLDGSAGLGQLGPISEADSGSYDATPPGVGVHVEANIVNDNDANDIVSVSESFICPLEGGGVT